MHAKRICLIDDDPIVRDALSLGLSDAGFDVLVAPGAAAALDMMGRDRVDAVVTDMKMPGFDGGALIAALRERWPELPVVAISGGGEIGGKSVSDIARDQGANACLVKPFRATDIAKALDALLTPAA